MSAVLGTSSVKGVSQKGYLHLDRQSRPGQSRCRDSSKAEGLAQAERIGAIERPAGGDGVLHGQPDRFEVGDLLRAGPTEAVAVEDLAELGMGDVSGDLAAPDRDEPVPNSRHHGL